jgi:hypothetical protein
MRNITRFVPLLALVALLPAAPAARADDPALARAKKLIEDNGQMICFFAVPTYKYVDVGFNSDRKLNDGYEVVCTFEVKSRVRLNTVRIAFLFDTAGNFESCSVVRHSTFWKPFLSAVGAKQLAKQRETLEAHPSVRDDRKMLGFAREANPKQLCELYLRVESGQKLVDK